MTVDAAWLKAELAAARFALREVKRNPDATYAEAFGAKNRVLHLLAMRPRPPSRPHARDVSDREFLAAVRNQCSEPDNASGWCIYWLLDFPAYAARPRSEQDKLVLAKARRVIGRGLMSGCTCGCRGDFELTPKGLAFLKNSTG